MQLFNSIQVSRPRLNKFNLSHERKFSMEMGNLTPIMCQEIIPGDKFRVNTQVMMRFAPLLAPLMHMINVYTYFFFVPNRLVWDEWEDFITGGPDGTLMPLVPFTSTGNIFGAGYGVPGKLPDYMGLPTITADTATSQLISVLPFRAYQLIYDEYFRDQNLTPPVDCSRASGAVPGGAEHTKLFQTRKKAWEKDYFTSALPWSQRGPQITTPFNVSGYANLVINPLTGAATGGRVKGAEIGGGAAVEWSGVGIDNSLVDGEIKAKIDSLSTSTTINDLRRSVKLQEWLEKNARGGARYIEQILSHFGVKSSDARHSRPEFLGSGKAPVVVSEVLQSVEFSTDPLGSMGGHALSVGNPGGFSRRFEEHGHVIGLICVLPKTAYQQGIPKQFSRLDKFDYFWPELATLGEQEVKGKEIYFTGQASETPNATFGYQSRYAEYKFANSTVHGEFKDSLAYWHMGRIFNAQPILNGSFIESDPRKNVFAALPTPPAGFGAASHHLWCQIYNKVDALRPMPYFGTPTI